jgi:hypothetical protein
MLDEGNSMKKAKKRFADLSTYPQLLLLLLYLSREILISSNRGLGYVDNFELSDLYFFP